MASQQRLMRGRSFKAMDNPLSDLSLAEEAAGMHVENLSNAVPISPNLLKELINTMNMEDDNDEMLLVLDAYKTPYLFTSADLKQLIVITESVRTRLAILSLICPRLTDPQVEVSYFKGLFRYSGEKIEAEEHFKRRIQTLKATMIVGGGGKSVLGMKSGGGRGMGGRGLGPGGRGPKRRETVAGTVSPKASNRVSRKLDRTKSAVGADLEKVTHAPSAMRSPKPNGKRVSLKLDSTEKMSMSVPSRSETDVLRVPKDYGRLGILSERVQPGLLRLESTESMNGFDDDVEAYSPSPVKPSPMKTSNQNTHEFTDDGSEKMNGSRLELLSPTAKKISKKLSNSGDSPQSTKKSFKSEKSDTLPEIVDPSLKNSMNLSHSNSFKASLASRKLPPTKNTDIPISKENINISKSFDIEEIDDEIKRSLSKTNSRETNGRDISPIQGRLKHSLSKSDEHDFDYGFESNSGKPPLGRPHTLSDAGAAELNRRSPPKPMEARRSPTKSAPPAMENNANPIPPFDVFAMEARKPRSVTPVRKESILGKPSRSTTPTPNPSNAPSRSNSNSNLVSLLQQQAPVARTPTRNFSGSISEDKKIVEETEEERQKRENFDKLKSSFSQATDDEDSSKTPYIPTPEYSISVRSSISSNLSTPFHSPKLVPMSPNAMVVAPYRPVSKRDYGKDDLALKYAEKLKISRDEFLSLEKEVSVKNETDEKGVNRDLFSYKELLRKNFKKEYNNVIESELEHHLIVDQFHEVFGITKVDYLRLAKWKQVELKKKVLLF